MQPAMWHGTGLRTSYQEYTLTLCTHTNNNDFLLHTCHVPKPWIRWPSIKALADHATTRWVGGWTGLAVARWCPPNDVSRFLPSLVRTHYLLTSINYLFWHFSSFARGRLWGLDKCGESWCAATFWKVKTNFCWFRLSLSDGRFGGWDTQWAGKVSMIQEATMRWNNLHSDLNITLIKLVVGHGNLGNVSNKE